MSIGLLIRREGDSGAPRRLAAALAPARIHPVIGRAASNVFTRHLRDLNRTRPNALGGKRTNYYAGAARATSFRIESDGVLIAINQIGLRQRFFGGTIRAKQSKWLTIPVAPEAHGKRAREFGDLTVVFGRGRQPVGLARAGKLYYALKKSVEQKPDPSVLPARATITAEVDRAVDSTAQRAWRRDQAPGS